MPDPTSIEEIKEQLKEKFGYKHFQVEIPKWSWLKPRKVETKCERCGNNQEVWCVYANSAPGALDWYDEYFHICLKCGKVSHSSELKMYGFGDATKCPYCQQEW